MRVQATETMAKALNKALKGNYCIQSVTLEKIPRRSAFITVGGGYSDCDIDWNTDTVKVIMITYKPECYACSQYATTSDLNRLFKPDMTLADFVDEFKAKYEI